MTVSPNQYAMVKKQLSFYAASSYWESETTTEMVDISEGAVKSAGKKALLPIVNSLAMHDTKLT